MRFRKNHLLLYQSGLVLAGFAFLAASARADDLSAARRELDARYRAQLAELAAWCGENGLAEEGARTSAWATAAPQGKLRIYADHPVHGLRVPADATPAQRIWVGRFASLRKTQAIALFELARRAADDGETSLSMMWLTETIRENPEHAEARRILGYSKYKGRWLTAFDREQVAAGKVWHTKFGWIAQADATRYEAGERRLGSRWTSAEEDAERHSSIERGWEVDTAHYRVTTNHSLSAGVELASKLERLHEVWRQAFAGFLIPAGQLRRAFDGDGDLAASRRTPLDVVYFRSRDEYNRALVRAQPRIEMTLGIYFDSRKTAYFYAPDAEDVEGDYAGTLYHEATHQLFQETRRAARNLGAKHNFWVLEGIATYMESLAAHEGCFTLGGLDAGRAPAARERLLVDGFYVPFEEIVALGKLDLQRDSRIRSIYSQAAGQTAFLMHAGEGRYRQALVDYLAAVYQGKASETSLAQLAGRSYAQLDREYREYLQAGK